MTATDLPYRLCAGIMLINREGMIFVGERVDTPGAWQMPQGGIDAGEKPLDAALRELEEEIGVSRHHVRVLAEAKDWIPYDLPDHLIGKVWGGKYRGQKQFWVLMELTTGEEAINIETAHQEFSAWRWCSKSALIRDIVPFKRDVYRRIVNEFEAYIK